jgi:hypothetical protein
MLRSASFLSCCGDSGALVAICNFVQYHNTTIRISNSIHAANPSSPLTARHIVAEYYMHASLFSHAHLSNMA